MAGGGISSGAGESGSGPPDRSDRALEDFVRALLDRRYFELGRIQQKTGVSRTEVPKYPDQMVAAGRLSDQDRRNALENLTAWRRWGHRNAMFIIPLFVILGVLGIAAKLHAGAGAASIALPIGISIAVMVSLQGRYRQKRASRRGAHFSDY